MLAASERFGVNFNYAAEELGKGSSHVGVDAHYKVKPMVGHWLDVGLHQLCNDDTADFVQSVGDLGLDNIVVGTEYFASLCVGFQTLVVLAICNESI